MGSVKNLKKDIRYLTEVIISKAIVVGELLDDEEKIKRTDEVIIEAAQMHNELIARVNHPDGKANPGIVKKFYKGINTDLVQMSKGMFLSLNELMA